MKEQIEKRKQGEPSLFARSKASFLGLLALCAVLSLGLGAGDASAALDEEFTTLVTDITTYFGSIKTLVLAVVTFGIVISYAKMTKKR
jgi:hypothetical protein